MERIYTLDACSVHGKCIFYPLIYNYISRCYGIFSFCLNRLSLPLSYHQFNIHFSTKHYFHIILYRTHACTPVSIDIVMQVVKIVFFIDAVY